MDTQRPRGVGAGSYHAAFIRPPADCKGFAAQFGLVQFFNRTEKSIQIKM